MSKTPWSHIDFIASIRPSLILFLPTLVLPSGYLDELDADDVCETAPLYPSNRCLCSPLVFASISRSYTYRSAYRASFTMVTQSSSTGTYSFWRR